MNRQKVHCINWNLSKSHFQVKKIDRQIVTLMRVIQLTSPEKKCPFFIQWKTKMIPKLLVRREKSFQWGELIHPNFLNYNIILTSRNLTNNFFWPYWKIIIFLTSHPVIILVFYYLEIRYFPGLLGWMCLRFSLIRQFILKIRNGNW